MEIETLGTAVTNVFNVNRLSYYLYENLQMIVK